MSNVRRGELGTIGEADGGESGDESEEDDNGYSMENLDDAPIGLTMSQMCDIE